MMKDIRPFLKTMLSAPGLSGLEHPISTIIAQEWKDLADDVSLSPLGSLHALKRGDGSEPRRKVMLAAHMDAIGMMVTDIQDGFLHFTEIGGIDTRILPGQLVTVHGRDDLPGIIAIPAAHLLPKDASSGVVEMQYLVVDTGLREAEVNKKVRIGDAISFANPPIELSGETLSGHTLDNRVSVAAVTICLQHLQRRLHNWDVYAVATTQEEETLGGATTSPFDIQPDLAIVIDVTFAKGPGGSDWRSFKLGAGIGLAWGPNIHPALYRAIKEKADELEIPYEQELAPKMSGTDAMGIQVVSEGIPCIVLGIPLRYMHTPVETVSLKDIQRVGRLMAEFIADLEPEFFEKINWEEKK